MSFVNEKNRHKVYSKWNETYPNQVANEVEVYVSTNGNNNRRWVVALLIDEITSRFFRAGLLQTTTTTTLSNFVSHDLGQELKYYYLTHLSSLN